MQSINDLFEKITPRFWYETENGRTGLKYFTRMTPEMLEQVLHETPSPFDTGTFHQTELPILDLIKDMPGTLLHGYRRTNTWDISVEGVFLPIEFADKFQDRLRDWRSMSDWNTLPNEWDEGYLFHYEHGAS